MQIPLVSYFSGDLIINVRMNLSFKYVTSFLFALFLCSHSPNNFSGYLNFEVIGTTDLLAAEHTVFSVIFQQEHMPPMWIPLPCNIVYFLSTKRKNFFWGSSVKWQYSEWQVEPAQLLGTWAASIMSSFRQKRQTVYMKTGGAGGSPVWALPLPAQWKHSFSARLCAEMTLRWSWIDMFPTPPKSIIQQNLQKMKISQPFC